MAAAAYTASSGWPGKAIEGMEASRLRSWIA
jgi:hypothetical protein